MEDEKNSRESKRRKRHPIRNSLKWSVAVFAMLVLFGVAFLVYIVFFENVDSICPNPVLPESGAEVLSLEPSFQWESGKGPWEFVLTDTAGKELWIRRTELNSVRLPDGVLAANRRYHWSVYALASDGARGERLIFRPFSSLPRAEAGEEEGLWVYPARLPLSLRHFYSRLSLEVRCRENYRVELPEELLFGDGQRNLTGEGRAVHFFRFDLANAGTFPSEWAPITVMCGEARVTIPLQPAHRFLGDWLDSEDPGFFLLDDTPEFSNFEESALARLTQGTCVGIALTVKLFFERARWGGGMGERADNFDPLTILKALVLGRPLVFEDSYSFRDLSRQKAGAMKDIMSQLHLENLNPLNARATVKQLLQPADNDAEKAIWQQLRDGELALVAGFRLRRKVLKAADRFVSFAMLDSGHVFLAYRGWRFARGSVFGIYDPNYQYDESAPIQTALVFEEGKRPAYFVDGKRKNTLVRFVVLAGHDTMSLIVMALESSRQKFQLVLEKLHGIRD